MITVHRHTLSKSNLVFMDLIALVNFHLILPVLLLPGRLAWLWQVCIGLRDINVDEINI